MKKIHSIIKEEGVAFRNNRIESLDHLNRHDYFYILGFIYADGSLYEEIRKNGQKYYEVSIFQKDTQILYDIVRLFNESSKIYSSRNGMSFIRFGSKKIMKKYCR